MGVSGEKRLPQLPNVPTFAESNIKMPGFEYGAWFGLVAAAGTPDAIVEKINAKLNDMKDDPETRARRSASGAEVKGGSASQFREFLTSQNSVWRSALQKEGVKLH